MPDRARHVLRPMGDSEQTDTAIIRDDGAAVSHASTSRVLDKTGRPSAESIHVTDHSAGGWLACVACTYL